MKYLLCALFTIIMASPALAQNTAQEDFMEGLALEFSPETPADYNGALRHYKMAAAAGSREALLALARLSAANGPVKTEAALRRERLLAAANAGWAEAAYMLAEGLENGEVPPEGLNPAQYYLQAAAAGFGPAALKLAEMYMAGKNVPPDEDLAALWFTVAAEAHEEKAALALGKLYASNPQVASRWLEKTNLPEAACLLGEIRLKEGRFIEAVNSFTVAADQDYAPAHLSLGLLNLDNDFGRRPDAREALRHLKIAAQADLPEGAYQLAHMYINGQATPKDSISGAFWLNRAAEKGHAEAKAEYDKLVYNFSIGQKKRLERMIEEGITPTMQTTVQ